MARVGMSFQRNISSGEWLCVCVSCRRDKVARERVLYHSYKCYRGGGRRRAASTCSTWRRAKAGVRGLQKISEAEGRRGNIKRLRMQVSVDEVR